VISQPLDAGVPRHVADLISGFGALGMHAAVVCPRESELWEFLSGEEHVTLHAMSAARNPRPADLRSIALVARLARRADVIHAHSSKAGFVGRLGAALAGRGGRCVFTPHAWSYWSAGGAKGAAYRRWERLGARLCARIVALTQTELNDGLAAGVGRPDQYRVVPNGVELERFTAPRKPRAGRILFVGRLAPPKRPDLAVEIIRRVRADHPGAELWIVGDGPQRADVERLVSSAGLDGTVRLLGARRDLPRLLRESACLLLPSDYESCPYAVLEAMAAGVPVVATRVGGVPELVEDGVEGILVPARQPEAAAAAVGRVLADPKAARAMGEAGRRRARERYSLERMVADTVTVYEELLGAARP
jgi:glycosyltransferase involved in cell wall biosynthesis